MKKIVFPILFGVLFFLLAPPVFANAFPNPTFATDPLGTLFIISLVITPFWLFNWLVEGALISLILKKKTNSMKKLILLIGLVNFLTIAPTIYLGTKIMYAVMRMNCFILVGYAPSCVFIAKLIAEIIPFLGEFLLYWWLFKRSQFLDKISWQTIACITFLANLLSFGLGEIILNGLTPPGYTKPLA